MTVLRDAESLYDKLFPKGVSEETLKEKPKEPVKGYGRTSGPLLATDSSKGKDFGKGYGGKDRGEKRKWDSNGSGDSWSVAFFVRSAFFMWGELLVLPGTRISRKYSAGNARVTDT